MQSFPRKGVSLGYAGRNYNLKDLNADKRGRCGQRRGPCGEAFGRVRAVLSTSRFAPGKNNFSRALAARHALSGPKARCLPCWVREPWRSPLGQFGQHPGHDTREPRASRR